MSAGYTGNAKISWEQNSRNCIKSCLQQPLNLAIQDIGTCINSSRASQNNILISRAETWMDRVE
jgi:hypothetical protein